MDSHGVWNLYPTMIGIIPHNTHQHTSTYQHIDGTDNSLITPYYPINASSPLITRFSEMCDSHNAHRYLL